MIQKTFQQKPLGIQKMILSVLITLLFISSVSAIPLKEQISPHSTMGTSDIKWQVRLNVQVTFNVSETIYNKTDYIIFGEAVNASDGLDVYDIPNPPGSPPPEIDAYFTTDFPYPHNRLLREIKQYSDTFKQWNFTTDWKTNSFNNGTTVTIIWNNSKLGASEYNVITLWRFGHINQTWYEVADMLDQNSLTWYHDYNESLDKWFLTDYFEIRCYVTHDLTVDSTSGGSVTNPGEDTFNYNHGMVVDLVATPDPGYRFEGWTGNISTIADSTAAITNITIEGNYSITANFEVIPSPPTPPPSGPLPPVADAGGPYQGFPDEIIAFDASESYALAGKTITGYRWDFNNNGTYDTDWLPTPFVNYSYINPGEYTVKLEVEDSGGLTDSDTTTVTILTPNLPPTKPEVTGPTSGNKNMLYNYTAVSTDPDNDTIQYIFEWGDGQTTTTEFYPSGTEVIVNHTWTSAGKYEMTVTAFDNQTVSEPTRLTLYIDAQEVEDIGYLIDEDGDGVYDLLYSYEIDDTTVVELQADGTYLLDVDGDGEWDYQYDPTTDTLTELPDIVIADDEPLNIFIVIVVVGLLLIALIVYVYKKKSY